MIIDIIVHDDDDDDGTKDIAHSLRIPSQTVCCCDDDDDNGVRTVSRPARRRTFGGAQHRSMDLLEAR
jgi:hypothetical protein